LFVEGVLHVLYLIYAGDGVETRYVASEKLHQFGTSLHLQAFSIQNNLVLSVC